MDLLEDRNRIYIVQELIMDGNLLEALDHISEQNISFTERDAANLIEKILKGLNYIHYSGYIHRDIKLENIMVIKVQDEEGRTVFQPSITDFGMAKAIKEDGKETLPVGTPLFMAPEILAQQPYDQKVDIWALGILVHVLLTSEVPFDASSLDELKMMIRKNDLNMAPLSVFHEGGEMVKDFIK